MHRVKKLPWGKKKTAVETSSSTKNASSPSSSSPHPAFNESASSPAAPPHGVAAIQPASSQTESPTRRLWNEAYDALKNNKEHSKVMVDYEKILAQQLQGGAHGEVTISSDHELRRSQMEDILRKGLDKTEKEASNKKKATEVIEKLILFKDLVAAGLKPSSQATLAWTAITCLLLMALSMFEQSNAHREGLKKVEEILKKTEILAPYRLQVDHPGTNHLRKLLLDLYEKILLFLVNSVCYCHRNWFVVGLSDSMKSSDWDKQLEKIETAERAILDFDTQIKAERTASYQEQVIDSIRSDKDELLLAKIKVTDPRLDKKRIEATKGGLLRESYLWALKTDEYRAWQSGGKFLWVRGDPGKGKTMLLCGIIDELPSKKGYYFCQATNSALATGNSVLRGLVWMLASDDQGLMPHIRDRLDGDNLNEINSWYALSETLEEMLIGEPYLVVDGLDECLSGRDDLIRLIYRTREKARWLISSRNWPEIEAILKGTPQLSLELHPKSINQAVEFYIKFKVDELAKLKDYGPETSSFVQNYLLEHANATFLWVALVCANLADPELGNWQVEDTIQEFPSDLKRLYDRMLSKIDSNRNSEFLRRLLVVATAVLCPISIVELQTIIDIPKKFNKHLQAIIKACASFLVLRNDMIEVVHQSAKDYIDSNILFNRQSLHNEMYSRSLTKMSQILKKDIYCLKDPAIETQLVQTPNPDPLHAIGYSCTYWIYHLEQFLELSESSTVLDAEQLFLFLQGSFLYWLEAISLLRAVTTTSLMLLRLKQIVIKDDTGREPYPASETLKDFVSDGCRFFRLFRAMLEDFPLQLYCSALVFSPETSVIRQTFVHHFPSWIKIADGGIKDWSAELTTCPLPGVRSIWSVSFSSDDASIVLVTDLGTILVYDLASDVVTKSKHISTYKEKKPRLRRKSASELRYPDNKKSGSTSRDQIKRRKSVSVLSSLLNESMKHYQRRAGLNLRWAVFGDGNAKVIFSCDHYCYRNPHGKYDMPKESIIGTWDLENDTLFYEQIPGDFLCISHDGRFVATKELFSIMLFQVSNNLVPLMIFSGVIPQFPLAAFSPDAEGCIFTSGNNTVTIWNTIGASVLQKHTIDVGTLYRVALSNKCKYFAVTIDAKTGRMVTHLYATGTSQLIWARDLSYAYMLFSKESKYLIRWNALQTGVAILDTRSGNEIGKFNTSTFGTFMNGRICVSNDERIMALAEREFRLIDLSQINWKGLDQKALHKSLRIEARKGPLALSKDGNRVLLRFDRAEYKALEGLDLNSGHSKSRQIKNADCNYVWDEDLHYFCEIERNNLVIRVIHWANSSCRELKFSIRNEGLPSICKLAPNGLSLSLAFRTYCLVVPLGIEEHNFSIPHGPNLADLIWSHDSKRLVVYSSLTPVVSVIDVLLKREIFRQQGLFRHLAEDGQSVLIQVTDSHGVYSHSLNFQSYRFEIYDLEEHKLRISITPALDSPGLSTLMRHRQLGFVEESWFDQNKLIIVYANGSLTTFEVWDLESGLVKQRLSSPSLPRAISLHDGKYVNCSHGTLSLEPGGVQRGTHDFIYYEEDWVFKNNAKLLWIPPAFRPESILAISPRQMFINICARSTLMLQDKDSKCYIILKFS